MSILPDSCVDDGRVQPNSCEGLVGYGEPLSGLRSNTVFIRFGDQLHCVLGFPAIEVKPFGIKNRGLIGLQDNFSQLHQERVTCLEMGKWGELYTQLASPTFWAYMTTTTDWRPGPTRMLAQPQQEVKTLVSTTPSKEGKNFSTSLAQ